MHKKIRKVTLLSLIFIMSFQTIDQAFDIAAKEIGKIDNVEVEGSYKNEDINENIAFNQGVDEEVDREDSVVAKSPRNRVAAPYENSDIDIKEKRTVNSKTYRNPDGTFTVDTYFEPIHFEEDGQFEEVDNTIENVSSLRSSPIYSVDNGLYEVELEDGKLKILNQDSTLKLEFMDAKLDIYQVKENAIYFSEILDNIDLEYRINNNHVESTFIINGVVNQKTLDLRIDKDGLSYEVKEESILFKDSEGNDVFTYQIPKIVNENDVLSLITFNIADKGESLIVTLEFNLELINNDIAVYPIEMKSYLNRNYQTISVDSAYIRSYEPNVNSVYYQLFVGYEDGSMTAGPYLGITRSYIHISGLNIEPEQEIISAELELYKLFSNGQEWNTIDIGKTSGYVKPSTITWNNKPNVSNVSRTTIGVAGGAHRFDIKSYVEDIYNGKNNTIELKATNESSAYTPNIFSSESGTAMPKVSVTYKPAYDVALDLDINEFDTEMRVFSKINKGFEAFSFDGIARPHSTMKFDLVERGKSDVLKTVTSKGEVDRYFINPIYITNYISDTQKYQKDDVNYTTNYIYKDDIIEFDTPYEYKVSVQSGSLKSTRDFYTDSFIKYKVKEGDNLVNIASYYGLEIDEIKEDNHLKDTNIIKADDILILRFRKDNPKVSKDIYTPPVRTVEYKAEYVNRGPRCSSGTCEIIDPVNAATGNYYYEDNDFTINDFDEFQFLRYYNSTGPQLSNMFGNGFTSTIESYITYDKDGNMLYFKGDGKIYQFDTNGSSFKSREVDKIDVSINNEKVTIKDLQTNNVYSFNEFGYLIKIEEYSGNTIVINYSKYGQIIDILVGSKKIEFLYDTNNLVKEIKLPNGTKTEYKYDNDRNLIEYIDQKGNTEKYAYSNKIMTEIKDKNGNVVTKNIYDEELRVVKQVDGNGLETSIKYETQKTIVTKPDGVIDVYEYDENDDITQVIQDGVSKANNTYDHLRNITSKTDEDGNVTKYSYDNGKLVKTEYHDGTYEEYAYVGDHVSYFRDVNGTFIEYTFDGDNVVVENNNGIITNLTYDADNRVASETDYKGVSKAYTYKDNMIASITHDSGLVESYEYDKNGNVILESDNYGKTLTYVLDDEGKVIQLNYPDGTSEQWTYDANGNTTVSKDRIGGITNNVYDKNNNLISSSKGNLKETFEYDELNRIIKEVNLSGKEITYIYDGEGRKVEEIENGLHSTTFEYDVDGNISTKTDRFGNVETNEFDRHKLVNSTDKFGDTIFYEYDSLGNETKIRYANGHEVRKTYSNGQLVKEINVEGVITEYDYNSDNKIERELITYVDGQTLETINEYDKYGNKIRTTENGVSKTMVYDAYNRQVSVTDSLGNTKTKEYDFEGNVVKEIDSMGYPILKEYDGLGNVIKEIDKNGNETTSTFNTNNQLVEEKDALGFITTYEYDEKSLLIKETNPQNIVTEYVYDQYSNQIKTLVEGVVVEEIEYDEYQREIYKKSFNEIESKEFDNFDRQVKATNNKGLTVEFEYDGNKILEEKDNNGLTTTYEYDEFDREVRKTDTYGRSEEKEYDDLGNIKTTKNFDGTTLFKEYDIFGNVIKETDEFGNITHNTYNSLNQLVQTKDDLKEITFEYNGEGKLIKEVNETNGLVKETEYDGNGNVIKETNEKGNAIIKVYDANNQVISESDYLGNTRTTTYDSLGNVLVETDALGNTVQNKYNSFNQVELLVDERGFETVYTYNEKNQLIQEENAHGDIKKYEYDDFDNLIIEVAPDNGKTHYEYDIYGREIKVELPNKKVISIEYDSLNNITKEVDGSKVIENKYDDLGRLIEVRVNGVLSESKKYNSNNQIIEERDANNNNKSTYEYDKFNNIVVSNEKGYLKENKYDINNNLIEVKENKNRLTVNTYDATNNLITSTINNELIVDNTFDANNNVTSELKEGVLVHYEYDAKNQMIKASVPHKDDINKYEVIQELTYDEVGNQLTVVDANGFEIKKLYDENSNVISEINKNGIEMRYEYDGMNRVIKAQNHEGHFVSYIYDVSGNLLSKVNNGIYSDYKYDLNNNLTYEKNESGYVTKYEYDKLNQMTVKINPDNSRIKYTYDKLGNKLSEGKNTYTYDKFGNVLTATNAQGTVENKYDNFSNKIEVKDTNGEVVSYSFDHLNRKTKMSYNGNTVLYTYNSNGQLTKVSNDSGVIAEYTYTNRNDLESIKQGNLTTVRDYDSMSRMVSQKTNKDGQLLTSLYLEYDANDNLIKETKDGKTSTYDYDTSEELIRSSKYIGDKKVTTTYSYDVFGNKLESASNGDLNVLKYNSNRQVESIKSNDSTTRLMYDKKGNMISKVDDLGVKTTYDFDELDQLQTVSKDHYVYTYSYDAEGERVKEVREDLLDYHYDTWYNYFLLYNVKSERESDDSFEALRSQVIKKEANNGACTTSHLGVYDTEYYKDDVVKKFTLDRNAEYTSILDDTDTSYFYGHTLLADDTHQKVIGVNNSVMMNVNENYGEKIEYTDYGYTDDMQSGLAYNGERLDETGLVYLRARYYDPELSRFIQIDNNYDGDTESILSHNKYAYTLNNPYKYVDRDGNFAFIGWVMIGVAVAVVGAVIASNKNKKKSNTGSRGNQGSPKKPGKKTPSVVDMIDFAASIIGVISKNAASILRTVKDVNSKAYCPKPENSTIITGIDFLMKFIDISAFIKDIFEGLNDGKTINTTLVFAKNLNGAGSLYNGIIITRDILEKSLTSFLKNPLSKLKNLTRNAINSVPGVLDDLDGFAIINIVLSVVQDLIGAAIEYVFNCISVALFYAIPFGTLLYEVLKFAVGSMIKTLLLPIIGFFAYFVGLIIDWGIDAIEKWLDVKREISKIIAWVFEKSWSIVTSFAFAVKKLSVN